MEEQQPNLQPAPQAAAQAPTQPTNPYINPPAPQPANPYMTAPVPPQPQAAAPGIPPQPVTPYAAAPRPKPPHRKSAGRDIAMAILLAVTCFIMTDCFIWTGTLGLGFAVGAMLFLMVEIWYIAPFAKKRSVYGVACIALFTIGCVGLVFSADHLMKFLNLLCLMLLTTCLLMESMELRRWEPGSLFSVGDLYYVRYAASFGKIGAGMYGLFHREKAEDPKRKTGVGKAMLGLLIAIPFILLLAFLLYQGDDAFRGMLDGLDFDKIPKGLLSLVLAIPVFIFCFSRLFSLRDIKRERRQESGKGLDPIVLGFFLLGVSLVYLAYLFSQLAYFFSGFMGFLPEDFTYAEYARRGFFELTVVSVINIVLVILSVALCRKKDGKLPIGVKLTSLFLCIFSLVLAFTEVAKMKMYMDSYGLTRLRILTTLFTLFLAAVFVTLIVRLFVRKTPYMKIAVIIGAALVIALNFVNIDRVIAQYNVEAYHSGALKTIDVHTITRLNDAAVPYLLELAEDDNKEIAQEAADSLYYRWRRLHETGEWNSSTWEYDAGELKSYDYRGFNLTSHQARELLLDNEELILSHHKSPRSSLNGLH